MSSIDSITESIKRNPVRLYAIATAGVQLIHYYVATFPTLLVLALIAATLGTGELVRSKVVPTRVVDEMILDERLNIDRPLP